MQEMSKFTAFKYQTEKKDYNKKQLKALELIYAAAKGHQHTHSAYGASVEVLKKKRLSKAFTLDEVYWLATEAMTIDMLGGEKWLSE